MRKDVTPNRVVTDSAKRRIPLSVKKSCQNYQESQHPKADEWQIEIAVPKSLNVSLADICTEESEGSSVTKTLERINSYSTSIPDNGCEYAPVDDKQDCSSVSNLVSDNFETKFVTVSQDSIEAGGLLRSTGRNRRFTAEVINNEEQTHSAKVRDRGSLDSTITENSFQPSHGCCSQVATEMACIQKQLLEIENKHSSLMEMLQVSISMILEFVVSL